MRLQRCNHRLKSRCRNRHLFLRKLGVRVRQAPAR
ncbi:Uncharacterised protein [Vibrio cholerae]|nr:Uncharacterised protein [Vibrio cholerae]CSA15751.1 Uncharacterised protein [Vibrio cholerae]CSC60791.1 Uncharacterised protein [Vibrio cholerae]